MRRFANHYAGVLAAVAMVGLAVFWTAYLFGMRINRTHSLPVGLYWVVERPPRRGDIVAFWPDGGAAIREARRRGYILPGVYNADSGGQGYGLMLKKLAAVQGDVVSITDDGVFVNGLLIPNTRPLSCDNVGDPLPVVRFRDRLLGENEALFISDYLPRSFDSRYFGVQNMRQIVEVVRPILVW